MNRDSVAGSGKEDVRPPRYVGARVLRVEDARYLLGRGQYIDDISLPRMGHAAFLRSFHPHARLKSINVENARALDGVYGIFTGKDLEDLIDPLVTGLDHRDIRVLEQRVLPVDKVRYVGEAVAVAVAVSRYVAEDACEAIEVEWEPLASVVDAEKAMAIDAPRVDESQPDNNTLHLLYSGGDVDRALAESSRVFTKRFYFGRQAAAPLETRGVIADYDVASRAMTIWLSTQMPHLMRTLMSRPLRIPEGKLRIISPDVGGGFGLKSHVFVEDLIIPIVSRLLNRPVKWIEDRYENLAASAHAREITYDLSIGIDEGGRFTAFDGHIVGNAGAYSNYPYTAFIDVAPAGNLLPGMYSVRNVRYEADAPLTNTCPTGAYRGTGMVVGTSMREILIDEIARETDTDPVELRLKNCIGPEPYSNALGQKYDGGSYAEAVQKAAELIEYEKLRLRQTKLRSEGRYLGIGFSTCVEPAGWGAAHAKAHHWGEKIGALGGYFDSASVTVDPDGSVTVTTGLHSQGQSHETTFAQLAADVVGVRMEDVRVRQGDTASAVYGSGTTASRSAVLAAGTIRRAGSDVREKLRRIAAEALESNADDIDIYDGRATVRGVPSMAMTVPEIAQLAYFGHTRRPTDLTEPALTSTRSYEPPESYNNSCFVATVEVDVETGQINVDRFVAVEDCGIMLNPTVVEGQITGGVAQGIGMALYEEVIYNEDGQLLSGTLMDFLYPTAMEVPAIEPAHLETPSAVTEGGVKGMGEAGLMTTPAAVVNAVADALSPLGVTLDRLPLTPDYVLSRIRNARGAGRDDARDASEANCSRV